MSRGKGLEVSRRGRLPYTASDGSDSSESSDSATRLPLPKGAEGFVIVETTTGRGNEDSDRRQNRRILVVYYRDRVQSYESSGYDQLSDKTRRTPEVPSIDIKITSRRTAASARGTIQLYNQRDTNTQDDSRVNIKSAGCNNRPRRIRVQR